jgi:hypothetical protein
MKIQKGKEAKIEEIKIKLDPVAKYTYDESSGYPTGFTFEESEVTMEELAFIQVEQSRQQLLITKILLGAVIFVSIVVPIIVGLIV